MILLEAYEWSFAIRQFSPAESAEEPPHPWSYSYPLPSDIIRLLRVDRGLGNSGLERNEIDHVLQGSKYSDQ